MSKIKKLDRKRCIKTISRKHLWIPIKTCSTYSKQCYVLQCKACHIIDDNYTICEQFGITEDFILRKLLDLQSKKINMEERKVRG